MSGPGRQAAIFTPIESVTSRDAPELPSTPARNRHYSGLTFIDSPGIALLASVTRHVRDAELRDPALSSGGASR